MTAVTVLLSAVLAALAVLHLTWAVGYWWPIRDEAALARAVLGRAGIERMPGAIPCALVGTALGMLAVWVQFPQDHLWLRVGTTLAALIFTLRGVAAWLPAFQRITPEPAFRRNDTRAYGPLCLTIAAGLWLVAFAA